MPAEDPNEMQGEDVAARERATTEEGDFSTEPTDEQRETLERKVEEARESRDT